MSDQTEAPGAPADETPTTTAPAADAAPEQDNPWKAKYQKADQRSVKLSGELREARERLESLENAIADLTKTNETLTGQATEAVELAKGLKGEQNRRALTDAVLAEVAPSLQSEAALMLKGLMAEDFQVTHETSAEQIAQYSQEALAKLRTQAQRLFSDAPRSGADASKPDFSNYRSYHEVPVEMRGSIPAQEFARLTGQPTSGRRLFDIGR